MISRSKTVLANQMQMGEEREGGGGANLRLTNTLARRMCDTPSRLLHIKSRGAGQLFCKLDILKKLMRVIMWGIIECIRFNLKEEFLYCGKLST